MSLTIKNSPLRSLRRIGRKQRGSTLIEILVALLVLSIGLLGLASLQSNGLKFNHSAYLRTQSAVLMYDIIDSMRANGLIARGTNCYVVALTKSATTGCNTVAEADVNQWKSSIANQMPSGDGVITKKAGAAGTVYTVTVQWEDRDDPDNPGQAITKSFSMDTEI